MDAKNTPFGPGSIEYMAAARSEIFIETTANMDEEKLGAVRARDALGRTRSALIMETDAQGRAILSYVKNTRGPTGPAFVFQYGLWMERERE